MGLNQRFPLSIIFIFCASLMDITHSGIDVELPASRKTLARAARVAPFHTRNRTKLAARPVPKYWEPKSNLKFIRNTNERKKPSKNDYANMPKYNGTMPRQPSISLKQDVQYDSSHDHFHIRSPNSLHIRSSPVRKRGSPWPMPVVYDIDASKRYVIDASSFRVYVKKFYNDVLEFNLGRFWSHVFQLSYHGDTHRINMTKYRKPLEKRKGQNSLNILEININTTSSHYPTTSMNESYSFKTRRDGVLQLDCSQVWGAIRGLETLSQIIQEDQDEVILFDVKVKDYPRFSHRGLMIDTARHFIQKKFLLENLEAMVQNKLNVFHWHMTDDQSFPFDSLFFPNMTRYGAYHPETHVYRRGDIAEIVEAARLRGIRVIPEFDSPGHTFSWGYGQPDILTPCFDAKGKPVFFGPMHPLHEKTYEVLKKLYEEIIEIFPDNLIHIGGDEVFKDCWYSNPEISAYMKQHRSGVESLLVNFTTRLQKEVTNIVNKRNQNRDFKMFGADSFEMMAWQEAFDEERNLSNNTIIQIWKNDERYAKKIIDKGHRVIFSSCWYLDISKYGVDWNLFYNCLLPSRSDPTDYNGRLIGGEVCMWTEYVDDQVLMPKLWPRASAAAERLWSRASQQNFVEAGPRIEEQNCRMKSRGINSGVLSGPSFCDFRKSKPVLDFVQSSSQNTSNQAQARAPKGFLNGQIGTIMKFSQRKEGPSSIFILVILVTICFSVITLTCGLSATKAILIKRSSNIVITARIFRLKKCHMTLFIVALVGFTLVVNILRLFRSPTVTFRSPQT